MSSSSRRSRREAARAAERTTAGRPKGSPRWVLPVAGLVIAAAAVIAIVLSQGGSSAGPSPLPSPSPSASSTVPTAPTAPVITGTSLPEFSATIGDPAKGLAAPVVKGTDYQGDAVSIAPTGRITLVIFAAHWCPHCQRELPLIQAWIDAGKAPTDVDLISVSTGIDPSRPNYPPEAWLESIGWTVPVIVDPTNTVAAAYGLSQYPFFVLLDGEGKVVARFSGEIPMTALEELLAAVPRS